jgi:hypothetical protein
VESESFPLDHPFDCPAGDGGRCTLPTPPVVVRPGGLETLTDGAGFRGQSVERDAITMLNGMGVEAMQSVIENPGDHASDRNGSSLVVTCSCGHVLVAQTRAD